MRLTILFFVLLGYCQMVSAQEARQTYDAAVSGMNCQQNSLGDMECNYRVGRSLHFAIAGVGRKDASIYFYEASMNGDYFALLGLSHGCVVVRPGMDRQAPPGTSKLEQDWNRLSDLAFVSPQNGRVYRTWETCAEAR